MGDGNRGQAPFDQQASNYSDRSRLGLSQSQSGRPRMELERQAFPDQSFALHQGSSPFNMEAMASALSNYPNPSTPYGQQHSLQQSYPTTPGQGMIYQHPSMAPFAGQTGPGSPPYLSFNQQQFAQQYQQGGQARGPPYPNMMQNPSQRGLMPGAQQFQAPLQGQPGPYPSSFGHTGQPMASTQIQMAPFAQNYPRPSPYNYMTGQTPQETYFVNVGQGGVMDSATHLERPQGAVSRQSSASSLGPSVPRGPPPKPKQSGHALWVGNLPPGTNIFDLKDHFSRDATDDIESVFLISKSNCAFANYKTEAACAAAMQRFNDTRFLGARLVCRLRRANPATSTSQVATAAQTVPSVPASPEFEGKEIEDSAPAEVVEEPEKVPETTTSEPAPEPTSEPASKVKERFFIIKSLTVEDLELSVRNGIWATQAHNEAALNTAFESAESVFLIFSANKSGEYFGYARMLSSISEESAASIDFTPRSATVAGVETELPNKIPTPATATAPRGYVIDDSARGTIFWEAETADDEPEATEEGEAIQAQTTQPKAEEEPQPAETQSFGKPFRIEWVSTEKLPFYRTRGLRNPWNANREIKIARDGTELEPSVGRRLVAMFHRPQMAGPGNAPRQPQVAQTYQMPTMMGFNPSVHQQQRYYQG